MKHLLPQVFPRDLCFLAAAIIALVLAAISAAAQDNSDHRRHRHFFPGADASLRIEVHVVSYTMTPPKHHRDDNDGASVVYNLPSRLPAMSVSEEERLIMGDAGEVALLKTTTVVPE